MAHNESLSGVGIVREGTRMDCNRNSDGTRGVVPNTRTSYPNLEFPQPKRFPYRGIRVESSCEELPETTSSADLPTATDVWWRCQARNAPSALGLCIGRKANRQNHLHPSCEHAFCTLSTFCMPFTPIFQPKSREYATGVECADFLH